MVCNISSSLIMEGRTAILVVLEYAVSDLNRYIHDVSTAINISYGRQASVIDLSSSTDSSHVQLWFQVTHPVRPSSRSISYGTEPFRSTRQREELATRNTVV
jgi:hypothetical protein